MDEWAYVELSEVATLHSGGTPSKSRMDYWGGRVPWISAKDMRNMRLRQTGLTLTTEGAERSRLMPAGTVFVLTRGMTLFRDLPVVLMESPAAFNQDIKALVPDSRLLPEFLAYALVARKQELLDTVTQAGHGTGRLDTSRIESFPIPLPALAEQRKIAKIIRTWDDAIERTNYLRGLAHRRYSSTVNSLLTGERSSATALGAATRPITGRNTALYLGRDSVMGVTNSAGIVPMRAQTIAADLSRYQVLPPRAFAYNPMRINVGSIAMSRLSGDVLVSPDYVLFECDEAILLPEYFDHVLETRRWRHDVNAGASGSVRTRTYYDDLAAIAVQIPPIGRQREIVAVLDTMTDELALLGRKVELLRTQKRGLMQKLLTGEIRVMVYGADA